MAGRQTGGDCGRTFYVPSDRLFTFADDLLTEWFSKIEELHKSSVQAESTFKKARDFLYETGLSAVAIEAKEIECKVLLDRIEANHRQMVDFMRQIDASTAAVLWAAMPTPRQVTQYQLNEAIIGHCEQVENRFQWMSPEAMRVTRSALSDLVEIVQMAAADEKSRR